MRLHTIKEAAIAVGISEYALRMGVRSGRFPAFRPTSSVKSPYLVSIEEIQRVIHEEMLSRNQQGER